MAYKGGAKVQKVMVQPIVSVILSYVFCMYKNYEVAGRAIKGGMGSVGDKRDL